MSVVNLSDFFANPERLTVLTDSGEVVQVISPFVEFLSADRVKITLVGAEVYGRIIPSDLSAN